MDSFFDKIKETFKEGARRIRETAKAAADKIDESAAELSRRIKSAAAGVKQSAADAFRSFKAAFKRPAGAADSGTSQNAAGADDGTTSAQSAERDAESRNGERRGARQTDTSGDAKAETDNTESPHEHGRRQCHTKARRFLVHVVDILAGLLFFSAVVIALKPDLLDSAFHISEETIYQNDIPRVIEMSEKVGSYLIQIKVSQTIPFELKIARDIFVALFLALYVVLKIVVVLLAKSPVSQKTVSALMIALTILACALLADKFWIFTAICLIASVAFAFSCGFPARTIFRKFAVFAALALCWYVGAHILTNYDECRKTLHEMGAAIVRFGEKAAAFFIALRLPVQA
ncbi:MAG: hypothetical protein K2I74_00560 [Treponemataceae bacterium]|nr:hypothetical protein [Treponemataceae bacterium]